MLLDQGSGGQSLREHADKGTVPSVLEYPDGHHLVLPQKSFLEGLEVSCFQRLTQHHHFIHGCAAL